MDLNLTDRDAAILRELLQDYLPTLKWETARTERHELRQSMLARQDVLERLLEELAQRVP